MGGFIAGGGHGPAGDGGPCIPVESDALRSGDRRSSRASSSAERQPMLWGRSPGYRIENDSDLLGHVVEVISWDKTHRRDRPAGCVTKAWQCPSIWQVVTIRAAVGGAKAQIPGSARSGRQPRVRHAPVLDTGRDRACLRRVGIAASGQRLRMRPRSMYSGTNTRVRHETISVAQPMRLSAARSPSAGPSISTRSRRPSGAALRGASHWRDRRTRRGSGSPRASRPNS